KMATDSKAPLIELFDERDGCKGPAANKASDVGEPGLCVKVSMQKVAMNAAAAKSVATNYMRK
nr:Chain A, cryptophyte phycocyanin alpha chain [Hemiselmis virescens]4LM6_C Chain C, cryptophyte phycocyanin alpha chain [Hemiselmis virescens]